MVTATLVRFFLNSTRHAQALLFVLCVAGVVVTTSTTISADVAQSAETLQQDWYLAARSFSLCHLVSPLFCRSSEIFLYPQGFVLRCVQISKDLVFVPT